MAVGWPRITRERFARSASSCCVARLTQASSCERTVAGARADEVPHPDGPGPEGDEIQAEHDTELVAVAIGGQGRERLRPPHLARRLVGGGHLAAAARLCGTEHRITHADLAPAIFRVSGGVRDDDIGPEAIHRQGGVSAL